VGTQGEGDRGRGRGAGVRKAGEWVASEAEKGCFFTVEMYTGGQVSGGAW
jgi:hypothetical protein